MCISNIGSRRPFPTNGFRNCPVRTSSAAVDTNVLKSALNGPFALSPSSKNPHIVVQHDYHDHAQDAHVNYRDDLPARGGVTVPFPLKLHDMLNAAVKYGHEHIVSWQPHGRCFVVHKPKEFVELLPQYFKLSKLASFQRQLNLYGFQRLTRGRDRGGYYHELFLRDRVFLAHSIQRCKVKGTGVRARSNPDQEPDFWSMPWVQQQFESGSIMRAVSSESTSSCSSSSCSTVCALPSPRLQVIQPEMSMFDNNGLSASFFAQKFPLHLEPTAFTQELLSSINENAKADDELFGKHFFDVEPSNSSQDPKDSPEPILSSPQISDVNNAIGEFLALDVDGFFEDFNFPVDIGSEIEDDEVFGNLLEQLIS